MVIYSFVGISGPLKACLLIERKKEKGERKTVFKAGFNSIAK